MKKSTTVATMASGLLKVLQRYTKGIRLVAVLTMLFTVGVGSMWGATTKTISSFSATSGTIGDVSYSAYKGGGTSNPAVNSNAIRLYQNSSGATGGYIVLSVPEGYKITSATIKSTMATTTGYYIASNPGGSTPAKANFVVSNKSLSANTEYTVSGLSTQYITFACFGTSSSSRLYLSYLSVTYESPAAQTYTVTLIRNGNEESINDVESGASLDDIDGTGDQGGCAEWSFVGWSKSQRSDQDDSTPMDLVTEVDGAGPYYAVYSHTADGGGGSTTKTMTTFTSTSGNIGGDANVSYAAEKGNAGTAPAVNDEEIRIYQNGGTLTITGNNGKKLTSITIGSSMKTSVSYKIDGGSESSANSITAGGKYTLSDIDATSVLFTCKGTDKNSRLYLNYLSVTYSGGSTIYYTTTPQCTTETAYSVELTQPSNGSISANPYENIKEGDIVNLTANPNSGYKLSAWTVVRDDNSQSVTVTNNTFTMPASDVTISATFVAISKLATPTNLQVTNISCTGATLTWDNVANNNGYTLLVKNTSSGTTFNSNIAKDVTSGSPTLNPGITYTWKVIAKGDDTNYLNSEEADGGSFTTNYKITYDVKGGSWTACADGCVAGGEDFTICSTEPTKDGYNFKGWSTADDTEAEYQAGGTINNVSANTTLYAVWEQPKYTVNWYVNSISKREQTDVEGAALTDIPEPTTSDCDNSKVFVGWTTKADYSHATDAPTGMITNTTGMTMPEGGEDYYAVFANASAGGGNSIVFQETFDTNNGTGGNDDQWSGTIASNDLSSDHAWSFVNGKGALKCAKFSSNSGGGSATTPAIDCGSSKNAILTFNAGSWKGDNTTLSLVATNCMIDLTSIALPDQKWGEYTINISNITGKITIKFSSETKKRFFLDEVKITTSGGTTYSDYTTTCDATKATVTYDLNGGEYQSGSCTPTTVTKGEAFNLCSNTPTKEGYTFAGWSDGTKTYAAGAEVTIEENTTFYASWNAKTITITWNLNYTGCPEAATSTYVYDGEEIEMPADPIRKGYKFTGWFTASSDGTQITEVGETNKPSADVTYYAHWAEQYSVTYIASGQQYLKQEYKYISGDKLVLPETNPSAANFACDGYLFEGWSTYQQTKEDAKCPELVDATTVVEKDLELHAVWKKASASGVGTQIFYESFNKYTSSGGNDDNFNTASSDKDNTISNSDNSGWSGNNVYGAKACVKLGGGSAKGTITTPTITSLSGDATLSFKAAAWNGNNEKTTLNLLISGGGSLDKTSVTLVKGAWTPYEVQIKAGTSSSKITFEAANASDNRFFLDEVTITTSGSYNYTTSPNCGPTMVAKESVWATSANGQSVKVNVPVGVKLFTGAATITGTSTNENFVVNTLENAGNGEHNLVVVYTPTADDTKENTTITLTAKNVEEVWSTTTFTLNGRSLPTEFVVVANRGDKNYALPANMTEANTYPGLEVEVNGNEVSTAPVSHLYNARAVHSTRFADNGTSLRLVGNNNACLWASSAASGTNIRNWAKLENANTANYEWNLYTEDGDVYYISSTAVTEEGRVLRLDGTTFGMYKQGVDAFRLLPVGCTSTPMNVKTSTTRTSATISWTNASACDLVVKQGETLVQNLSASVSPVVVSGLAESTAYTFTLTPTNNASCGVSGAFTTTGPTIDIVEWNMGGIRIQVDKDEDVNPIIIINGEKEHGNVGGQVATELFFSKYYEAHAENKLLAVYNGTTQIIDLNGYVIKHGGVEIELDQYGQTKGSIAPNEEIILVAFDDAYDKSAESCAEKEEGFNTWNVLEKELLAFSGRGSVGLYKDDVLIDLIGSTYPSGELTKIGKSDKCGTGENVRLHIGGVSVNDQSSFFCYDGDNIKTPEVEIDYPISTNRCLLIRKNTVTSGATAVTSNKAEAGATCGDLSSTFTTLCTEWSGFRIGSGSSSTAEIQKATCEGLGYVGGFDYNNYYRTMETIYEGTKLDEYDKNPNDNTYFIEFEVSEYACLNIQLQLTDDNGNVLTDQITQVPILVYDKKTTTDELFSAIVKDGETPDYENSKIRCATCDVVIQYGATLTKVAPGTGNDVNQVRDIYVYPGGKLIVPEEADDYSVNSISLRRDQDEVASASILAPLNITSSSKTPVYVDIRINSENWHWMTLPYDCNIADVTWKDGSKAIYNSDWFLMYYDGESRSKEQSHYENHWKVYEGTTIEAGKGYIVGITGHPTKSGVQYELRFPMAIDVLTADNNNKTVPVNAWGAEDNITPNKKGWNLVGNPYLDYYQRSAVNSFNGLRLGGEYEYDETTGKWSDSSMWDGETKNLPYIVIPVDGGWTSYDQVLASEIDLKPFTSYFVQVGNSGDANGQQYDVQFKPANRGRASLIRRAPSEIDEVEEPVIVGVSLTNTQGESDKTSLIIDNQYTDEYEMNADFFKWFGDYYKYYTKPVLYTIGADDGKRAFNAISEELASQPISLGMYAAKAGDYTFTLDRRSDLSRVQEVWLYDAAQETHINLLQESYTFHTAKTESAGRFFLSVKMAPKVSTEMDNVTDGTVWATTQDHTILVNGMLSNAQLWIYDATGKLLHTDHTKYYQHSYSVPVSGTYFVRVQNTMQTQTIKVVVE